MILNQNMVSDAEVIYQPTIPIFDVQYRIRLPQDQIGGASASSSSPGFEEARAADSVSRDVSCFETVMDSALIAIAESTAPKYAPTIRSGSCTDIGHRTSMDDEHIRIDDLSTLLGTPFSCCNPSAFYAVFDGHGGPEAASYVKQNAMKLFFEENLIPEGSEINNFFLQELEASHRRAFLLADLALADETTVSGSCGTTAITALVLENHLMVANVGDCRAVLCRRGSAINLSQDHRPSFLPERKRVEDLGGVIYDGYLNGSLSITRALGDWELKLPFGTSSPLIADPDIQQVELTEEDEFLIIGCDGLWDVMSSQCAVSLVRRAMRRHNDPQQCAKELVSEALRLNTSDNLTAIVVSLAPVERLEPFSSRPRRMRRCSVSEEGRNRLMSLLGGGN